MTQELDLGNQRLLTHSPILGTNFLSVVPMVETIFKDMAMREQCVVEMTWTEYVTDLVKVSI